MLKRLRSTAEEIGPKNRAICQIYVKVTITEHYTKITKQYYIQLRLA